ncbi:MAG: hypothetical protein ABS81_04980 [Pseudonocardia sp. SCN 72-86]|nr:MAG: hypothetical protein ABS81_04980 [Pseudonocardia sp. SCN 72-86]
MSDLHVDVVGTGDPVLLVHGIGGTGNAWGPIVGPLAKVHKLIVPDLAGCGRSAADKPFGADDHVNQLVELLDVHEIETVHVVGHSFGANLSQRLALRLPGRVRTLALLGGGPGRGTPPSPHPLQVRADRVRAEGLDGVADDTVKFATAAATSAGNPVAASFVRELVMGQDPENYARTCEAAVNGSPFDSGDITCPTLLLTGVEDVVTPPGAGKALAAQLPDATLRLLADCGHWPSIERPQTVAEALLDFFAAH